MKTLKLKNRFQTNATLVANDFIDTYMSRANGEFVKVYLFLLRHWDDSCSSLTISMIADNLNNTEKDILRAFRYWENEGLLLLDRDSDGKITGLELKSAAASTIKKIDPKTEPEADRSETSPAETEIAKTTDTALNAEPETVPPSKAICLDSFKAQKELRSLFFIAEQYLGKTLSKTDIDAITYFYDTLDMSADLVEYLIEYCVENGHKSIHYIRKVAVSWADEGITTVEQARLQSINYNKNYYTVLHAFGIHNRSAAAPEIAFIRKWTEEYAFSLDIVEEACNRTITAIHQPNFAYADTILQKWFQSGVHHLKDIAALDNSFRKNSSAKDTAAAKPKPTTKNMNNFERRVYDMDSLEEKLLNSN